MAKKVSKKQVISNIQAATVTPEGKRKKFDPKNLDPAVVNEVIKAYVSTEGDYAALTNMKQVAAYFSDDSLKLSEDFAKKIVYMVFTDPFNFKISLARQVIQVASGNSDRHYSPQKASLRSTEWNALQEICEKRLPRLEEDIHNHLDKIKESFKWYLNSRLTYKQILYKYGWSGDEFRFIERYAACVLLNDTEYGILCRKRYDMCLDSGYWLDALKFIQETENFRNNYAEDFKKLDELRQNAEKNQAELSALYDKLYNYFTSPLSFLTNP